jgi:hypothetical protein
LLQRMHKSTKPRLKFTKRAPLWGCRRNPVAARISAKCRQTSMKHFRLAAGGTGSEPSVPPDRSSGGTSPADNRSDPPTLSSSGARDGFVPLELSYFRPVRPERPASTCGTRRRYGAGGEDGNFVAACNRWSARCPSRTT